MTLDKLHHLHVPQLYHFENGRDNIHLIVYCEIVHIMHLAWRLVHSKDLSILAVYT